MVRDRPTFWRRLRRRLTANRDIQIVLDRRKGERRQRVQAVEQDRRRDDRRRPESSDLGEVTCFLGEGCQFKGNVRFHGGLRIDGQLEGAFLGGEVLIIGEHGQVDAEIEVELIQVSGHVRGDITAKRWAELLDSSQVTGTIRTPRLTIWRGAIFNGKCEMPGALGDEKSAPQPNEDAASPRLSHE
jgi:cytoskeletal protein CcmA (bactofilin family)